MSSFSGSTAKFEMNDGGRKKKYTTKEKVFVLLFIVLVVLTIVFLALYVKTDKKLDKTEKDLKGANERSRLQTTAGTVTGTGTGTVTKTDTTITPTHGIGPFNDIRLPKYVNPMHYDVVLEVDMSFGDVAVTANVTVNVTKPTKYFIVHASSFISINGVIKDKNKKVIPFKKQFLFPRNHYYVTEMHEEMPVGIYQLDYNARYKLRKDLKGFYQSTYKAKDGKDRLVAATQFEPVDARTAFPCFDEPAMKATFNITIEYTTGYIALSNMPIIKTTNVDTGAKLRTIFEKSPVMPTYLLVFVICDFANKTTTTQSSNPVKMTYYAPADQIDQIDYAMKVGKEILPFFEQYYKVPYPLPKADMIAIPDFAAGAMENWGLITYRAKALLFDNSASSISNKMYIASVVSHELAHQWFGNIVTMEWWSDLWLNEGFASYVEYLGVNYTESDWNALDFQVITDMDRAFSLDALVTSHPIYIEVKHPDEINEIFDTISYAKGGSILRMLDDFIGNDVFRQGLSIYLKKYSYANAKTNDLWDALSEASKLNGKDYNVSEIMSTWILQMGFPVVKVEKSSSSYKLTQKRFLIDPNPDLSKSKFTSPFNYKWMIPFKYKVYNISDIKNVQVGKQMTEMMRLGDGTINLPNSSPDLIIKGNVGQYGFFRVNYDQQGWKNIKNVLMNDHTKFDATDRAGILSDAFALASSGKLTYETALDLLSYIDKEEEYLPWKAASGSISYIPSVLTRTKPALSLYSKYMLKKVSALYAKYNFTTQANQKHMDRYLQVLIVSLACANGHKGCLTQASDLFKKFIDSKGTKAIHADFRSMVYYYGVLNGGEKEWNFLYQRYLNNKIATEKTKLMYGMSAIQEPWMINRYLQMGLNESIVKSQDASYVFSYVSNSNSNGRYMAWNFLKENWSQISQRFSKSFFTMRRIFSSVTSGFTTQYELDELKAFVSTKITDLGTAKRIVTQSEEKIKATIAWLNANEETIEKWLAKQV